MKSVLIVFPDCHLPYSPTTLNLFYALKKAGFNVKIIAPQPNASSYSLRQLEEKDVYYFNQDASPKNLSSRIWSKVRSRYMSDKQRVFHDLKSERANAFIGEISRHESDIYIAVDFFAFWCVRQAGKRAHLVSLEINEDDIYYRNCDFVSIESVVTQSLERYEYLFRGKHKPPCVIIPNSPNFVDFLPEYATRDRRKLVFCGSAIPEFGVFSCLDFISDYPEYTLTIKGNVPPVTMEGITKYYSNLIDAGSLILDDEYLDPVELTYYISKFSIGFVFYDFFRFSYIRRFNYLSAPSGKLFQYFNSGIPIVGNRLDGLNVVEERNSGCLVGSLGSRSIFEAVKNVEMDYLVKARNAKALSAEFDSTELLDVYIRNQLIVD